MCSVQHVQCACTAGAGGAGGAGGACAAHAHCTTALDPAPGPCPGTLPVEPVPAQVRRVLRPGGVLVFDTINRSYKSYLLTIVLAQEPHPPWPHPPSLH